VKQWLELTLQICLRHIVLLIVVGNSLNNEGRGFSSSR
jgi:hypothetical protein